MNPSMSTSPADAHHALTDERWVSGEPDIFGKEVKSIMMVSYVRARSSSPKRRSTVDVAADDEEEVGVLVIPRQREPRENSNFLRVIVAEMNMRRSGKLDAKAAGHARVWLPPRAESVLPIRAVPVGMIPQRWVGISVDDI
jgi:hypothetical protein